VARDLQGTIGDTGGAYHVGLTLTDGRSVKLLWAKSTLTYDSLHDAMSHWLNDRMVLGEPC